MPNPMKIYPTKEGFHTAHPTGSPGIVDISCNYCSTPLGILSRNIGNGVTDIHINDNVTLGTPIGGAYVMCPCGRKNPLASV